MTTDLELEERAEKAAAMFDDAMRAGMEALVKAVIDDADLSLSEKAAALVELGQELADADKHPGHPSQRVHGGHGGGGGGGGFTGGGGGDRASGATDTGAGKAAFIGNTRNGDIVRARANIGGRDVSITGAVSKKTADGITVKGQANIDGKTSIETVRLGADSGRWSAENITLTGGKESDKAGRRMNREQQSMFKGAMDNLKRLFNWSNYVDDEEDEDGDGETKELAEAFVLDEASGFKVVETKDGLRWVSFSSNAFLDYDKEIFSTASLEDAVRAADDGDWVVSDKSPRGPLRIFHVDGADIGDADFQAVVNRFLVESGTFRDDELGQKAVEYLQAHKDEKLQVSIGYRYKVGDEEDGVYDWVRITERSILPEGSAANPYTSFNVGGDDMAELDERKTKMLNDWFGEDFAGKIITKAQTQSKELEGNVRFKSKDEENAVVSDLKALVADTNVDEDTRTRLKGVMEKLGVKDEESPPAATEGGDESAVVDGIARAFELFNTTVEQLGDQIAQLSGVADTVKQLQETVTGLSTDVKAIKESPRGSSVFRASEAAGNEVDAAKAKEMVGAETGDPPVNPAIDHVSRLLNLNMSNGSKS